MIKIATIKLKNAEQLVAFVNICSKCCCEIEIHCKTGNFDAKSIVEMYNVGFGIELNVFAVTNNEELIYKLKEELKETFL